MLDFLKKAIILAPEDIKSARPRRSVNPDGMTIRVFYDGRIYPSEQLVKMLNLEYKTAFRDGEGELVLPEDPGNGFDVFDSGQFPLFRIEKRVLVINLVKKTEPKVDIFASTVYEEDGKPKSSVLDQGAKTFGTTELLPMLKEVYGITADKDTCPYIDLTFLGPDGTSATSFSLPDKKTVCYIPKKISRGKSKDEYSVTRRENPTFWVLYPAASLALPAGDETAALVPEN